MGLYTMILVTFVGFPETLMEFQEGWWMITILSTSWEAIPLGLTWNWMGKWLRDVADANAAVLSFTVGQAKARYPREEQN